MIDLETLSTKSNAVILSIGACYFNPYNQTVGDVFHQHIDIQSCLNNGMDISASTLTWWIGQNMKARKTLINGQKDSKHLSNALLNLSNFILGDCRVWGNGSTFDITILETAYELIHEPPPWKFYNVRDCRTVEQLAYGMLDKKTVRFAGTQHDALADACHQAKYISMMYKLLKVNRP